MKCWFCEASILDEPKTEYVMVHWKCLDRLRMDIDHLINLEKERDE